MTYQLFISLKKDGNLIWDNNYPGGAYYYPKWDSWYDNSGHELRDKSEYDSLFGDE